MTLFVIISDPSNQLKRHEKQFHNFLLFNRVDFDEKTFLISSLFSFFYLNVMPL